MYMDVTKQNKSKGFSLEELDEFLEMIYNGKYQMASE
jgi:hypothetical protein